MYRLGVDIGGTGIKVGLVDCSGSIIHKDTAPTDSSRHYSEVVKDIAALCDKVVTDSGKTMQDISFIGVGCPGSCDSKNGVVIYSNNIDWNNVPLITEMQRYIDKPMLVSNDANCAALGEAIAGATKGTKHSIMITLGTGIGGGIIIDGKIYAGFNDAGAELGHTVLVTDGNDCTCGRKGCWEVYSSATALKRMTLDVASKHKDSIIWSMIEHNIENISGKTAFDAARREDFAGQQIVDMYIKYLAEGLTNIINIFQPEKLAIGGGVCNEGEYLLKPVKKYVAENVYSRNGIPNTEIVIATLGNDAGIIGSAYLDNA